ncbi:hypothetical protein NBO_380g0003 [Nosema bombycis CQ1]|uniref:Uncharacterized protein n=1 Tax=Nosema bombycis (strain CQ1 / CVCC 102059) TaxID=578461 RepID=R0MIR3_NOSB1|nr:hypothetical protein NBO_380g0003 [Nosema bombycis CQ1]|eukprot:EOB12688.1 hypothetical protein NBO_380g0003 [Nosema bombycis CQ1]
MYLIINVIKFLLTQDQMKSIIFILKSYLFSLFYNFWLINIEQSSNQLIEVCV